MNLTRLSFIKLIADSAKQACKDSGLFPSVLIAQACLESRNGQSQLSAQYNNFFGVKAIGKWGGPKVFLNTREVIKGREVMVSQPFRVYESMVDSFADRCRFLKENPRYTKAGVFAAKTAAEQCDALLKAGYATDPLYATLLKSIIKAYGLERYDHAN